MWASFQYSLVQWTVLTENAIQIRAKAVFVCIWEYGYVHLVIYISVVKPTNFCSGVAPALLPPPSSSRWQIMKRSRYQFSSERFAKGLTFMWSGLLQLCGAVSTDSASLNACPWGPTANRRSCIAVSGRGIVFSRLWWVGLVSEIVCVRPSINRVTGWHPVRHNACNTCQHGQKFHAQW